MLFGVYDVTCNLARRQTRFNCTVEQATQQLELAEFRARIWEWLERRVKPYALEALLARSVIWLSILYLILRDHAVHLPECWWEAKCL